MLASLIVPNATVLALVGRTALVMRHGSAPIVSQREDLEGSGAGFGHGVILLTRSAAHADRTDNLAVAL